MQNRLRAGDNIRGAKSSNEPLSTEYMYSAVWKNIQLLICSVSRLFYAGMCHIQILFTKLFCQQNSPWNGCSFLDIVEGRFQVIRIRSFHISYHMQRDANPLLHMDI